MQQQCCDGGKGNLLRFKVGGHDSSPQECSPLQAGLTFWAAITVPFLYALSAVGLNMTKGAYRMSGSWTQTQIAGFIAESQIPLRLAVLDAKGCPLVLSLWYLCEDGDIWCATNAKARVLRFLRDEPRCGFEIAGDTPPYRGVRSRGRASLHPERGGEVLKRLFDRYGIAMNSILAVKLLARIDQEVAIRIAPDRFISWDFSQRMKDVFG